jgi:hypothetical protein
MLRCFRVASAAALISLSTVSASAPPGISLVGIGYIPGSALDLSGLSGEICQAGAPSNCIPRATFGGLGSDLAFTGHDDVYVTAPDRGPFDGLTDVPYLDRVHFVHLTTNTATKQVTAKLLDTRFLKNQYGQTFVGSTGAFDANSELNTLRLDPEGIRVSADGTFFLSDEYGPYLFEFDRQGHLLRRIEVPESFLIAAPNANPTLELTGNTAGRQANRGMEGLAISPEGGTLFGMMQNALLQDNALIPGSVDRQSVNTRILKVDLATGVTSEYVYQLDAFNRGQGVSEILAINDHEFLVVERDNRSWLALEPQAPTRKSIYRINLTGATDVTGITLPASGLPAGVKAVTKSIFINLLDPDFGLQNNDDKAIAEKIEGLAWGPDLADGRHLLYVISDNDLSLVNATQIYAFAIDDAELLTPLNLQHQTLPGPLYPPGQVKKALGDKRN